MLFKIAFASLVFGGLAVLPADPPTPAGGGPDGRFNVDSVHSSVVFKIRHSNVSNFYGRFNEVTGMVLVDASTPAESMVSLKIPTAKIDTNNPDRDKHLRGPDFFNADEFKAIEFESTKVTAKGDDGYEIVGDLSLHGMKKPVTATVKRVGYVEKTRMGTRAGFEATFKFKRSDFGMSKFVEENMLGDEIEVIVSLEVQK